MTRIVTILYDVCKLVKRIFCADNLFSLSLVHSKEYSKIRMEMLNSIHNTRYLPHTYSFLQNHLPSILNSKCFNDNNYPFPKEVKATQMGHLFEHIILEYLSSTKRAKGISNHIHKGLTKWDWNVDKLGVFHINIDAGVSDREYFASALEKSTLLFASLIKASA